MQTCVLYERMCVECGECDRCDLDPSKRCTNCCECIQDAKDYAKIDVHADFDPEELRKWGNLEE